MNNKDWYKINNEHQVDSPALLFYKERITINIKEMILMAGGAERLIPHVKTNKCTEVIRMQLNEGINKFKCATISEAEMVAEAGASTITLAYQLNRPKAERWLQLIEKYPKHSFSSLVDNYESAILLNQLFKDHQRQGEVFIDIDNGMHRSGHPPDEGVTKLYYNINELSNLRCLGLHFYDGHIRETDVEERRKHTDADYAPILKIAKTIELETGKMPMIIAGGTPSFTIHATRPEVYCSPGTSVLWDWGYDQLLPEQPFQFAAVLMTRIISKPEKGLITTDLGYKSVAAENVIKKRVHFLNLENYQVLRQSEEHLVVAVDNAESLKVGDLLYAIPYHVCPTVALYEEAQVVENGKINEQWEIIARRRKISI